MMNCTNCNQLLEGKYCSHCGHPAKLKRIDSHYITHEIQHVLHVEKGIFYTVRELVLRPGQSVRTFLTENRSKLMKPIIFIVITSLIYTLTISFFHIKDGYVDVQVEDASALTAMTNWVKTHYGYSNIIMAVFIALWIKLFFRKHGYNFYEIIILLCFLMGLCMLLFAVFGIAEGLLKLPLLQVAAYLYIAYTTWAIGDFFGKRKAVNYIKAFLAYILGMISFWCIVTIIALAYDGSFH